MEIDWITFVAQIVNFVLLVYLLKRFLYRPVMDAIERREEGVRKRLEDARRTEEEAQEGKARFEALQRELERTRAEVLRAAEEEAEQRRQELTTQVRDEVRAIREDWRESLRRQRDAFLHELRRRMSRELFGLVERVLEDLASADLEDRLLEVFLQRLPDAHDSEREELVEAALTADRSVRLRSSFPLSTDQRERLRRAVVAWAGTDLELSWEEDPGLTLGIELQAGDRKLAWSVDEYLQALETDVARLLEIESR
ncbi:MAG: F0F1 ATP synthase subunit delta [Longimicrobiales bacterium]|nr:F0F1 ATP synthase subunit delta [Longimicrobiales bacterium]